MSLTASEDCKMKLRERTVKVKPTRFEDGAEAKIL
jgi:hypothetical protein